MKILDKKFRIKITVFLLLFFFVEHAFAQLSVNVQVGGDFDKFYPVLFTDVNWDNDLETVINIGRSNVHRNSDWRGSLISNFSYHTTVYGHGSNFISADIRSSFNFIGGWVDASTQGGQSIIIWLRGGGTSYHLNSAQNITYAIYDGIQNTLPYVEPGGLTRNFLTQPENYVNSGNIKYVDNNMNIASSLFVNANVGIGTTIPQEKLSVNGKIRAKEVKVEATGWPDYVFKPHYKLLSLSEIEKHIKEKGHLPEMTSAKEVETKGIELGEMNKLLLKKIEELTLYLIEKDKQFLQQRAINKIYEERLFKLEKSKKKNKFKTK